MDPTDCPLCLLASRTLRRDLAESLLFWFVPSEANKSGRGFMDVAQIATRIAESTAPELFGMVTAEPLDAEPPRIAILPSEIRDERGDDITFDAYGPDPLEGQITHITETGTIPADGNASIAASCPPGQSLLSGGCALDSTDPSSYQAIMYYHGFDAGDPNTWHCAWNNPTTRSYSATLIAACYQSQQ